MGVLPQTQKMIGGKAKETRGRALWKNYDMWAAIFLVIHALAWLFIQQPFLGQTSLYQATIPYELMAHLPFRINPEYPHPIYKNNTHLGRRAWCNPLFRNFQVEMLLKNKTKTKVPVVIWPLQDKKRKKKSMKHPVFVKMPFVKKQVLGYKQDAKEFQDTSKEYLMVGFRSHSVCMLMPQQGNQEGACWGEPHIDICLKKFPLGMYGKFVNDSIKANASQKEIAMNKASLKWAKGEIDKIYGEKKPADEKPFPCGYPDFCKIFGLGTDFSKTGLLGRICGILYFLGLIPLILTLFDPPPAVPHRLERISHKIAVCYPWLTAILFTGSGASCILWMYRQYVILNRDVNTEALREAYPYIDENNPGFKFEIRTQAFSTTMYGLVPTLLNAIVYWVLIACRVKYPRFPSKILERRRKFEEGYAKLKTQIMNMSYELNMSYEHS